MLFHIGTYSILDLIPLDIFRIQILFQHCATEHVKNLDLIP